MSIDPLASFARAQRAHEHLGMLELAHGRDLLGKWVAIFLGDGRCDLKVYETKAEAIRWQKHETQCAYLCMNGIPTLGEIRLMLDVTEELYDKGLSLADPDTYVNPEFML